MQHNDDKQWTFTTINTCSTGCKTQQLQRGGQLNVTFEMRNFWKIVKHDDGMKEEPI